MNKPICCMCEKVIEDASHIVKVNAEVGSPETGPSGIFRISDCHRACAEPQWILPNAEVVRLTIEDLEGVRSTTTRRTLRGIWTHLPISHEMAGALTHARCILGKAHKLGDFWAPLAVCDMHGDASLATVSPFYLVPQPGDDCDGIFEPIGNFNARVTIYNGDGAKVCTVG